MITFTQPGFLALLALIPLSVLIALPRLRRGRRADIAHPHARAGLVVRSIVLTCVICALAGAQSVSFTDRLAVVFLVDVSDSVGAAGRDTAVRFVREALATMRPAGIDQSAIVLFGADAHIERGLSDARQLDLLGARVRAGGTHVESAIRLGLSLFPTNAAKRLVLISDGKQTAGDAEAAARLARALNVQLDVVPVQSTDGIDAAITRVDAPQTASVGQLIPLEVTVLSNAAMPAQLTVFSGSEVVAQQAVNLLIGNNRFNLRVMAAQSGFSAFRIQLIPEADTIPQNNMLSASVIVGGKPRVLLVSNAAASNGPANLDEAAPLRAALTAAGIDYDESAPAAMPTAIQSLAAYQAVVLVNAPARELSLRAMLSLQSYVRDIGGGLVVVGGPNSYGVGGYFKTPLEETLPVESQVKDPRRFPSVAMAIVMDKSGSMSAQEGGVPKMRLAAEAAARAAELINDDDEITIIGFDTTLVDQIGPFAGRDRQRFIPDILRIAPGGGGIYVYESLIEARRVLGQSDKRNKFIILLADGSDSENQSGARELTQQMRAENITLSVVAIGDGSDVPFLKEIARIGGGRFHLTDRAATLPTIFTEETALAQRSYVVEQTVVPKVGANSPMLSGIEAAPAMLGYVATTPKPAAQIILWANDSDPLLAAWQYGLGRAVAFTSDATGRWGRLWVNWDAFPKFWAQVVRWTILERPDTAAQAQVTQEGDWTTITVETPADDIQTAPVPPVQATLIDSNGNAQRTLLRQVAPGRYESQVYLREPGAYVVHIQSLSALTATAGLDQRMRIDKMLAWAKPYSAEYLPTPGGEGALLRWAELGGGAVLTRPADAFRAGAPAAVSRTDLFPWLLAIAACLLPFDVGVRRIAVSFRKALGTAPRRAGSTLEQGRRMERLMHAKARSSETWSAARSRSRSVGAPAAPPGSSNVQISGAPMQDRQPPDAPTPAGATAAELLRRRRKRSQESHGQGQTAS
ncbi:MAG: VWA domain-containing protein [Anaerolineae bacterium]|nr:VWA domain-containing protein [Thermoflexales bacterium]MDW8407227.1 VWA domain-containing protein [Anaerolineae bacterium]